MRPALGIFQPGGFEKIDVAATLDKGRCKIAHHRLYDEWKRETFPERSGIRAVGVMELMKELQDFREWGAAGRNNGHA